MRYFIAYTVIYDGDYEYGDFSPVQAESEDDALELAERLTKEWTDTDDYRGYRAKIYEEITKAEFDVISKYIPALDPADLGMYQT
jgi:hypothetical protein